VRQEEERVMISLNRRRGPKTAQFLRHDAHEIAVLDPESRLLAFWYLKRRWKEERARSSRYGCALSMVVVSDRSDDVPQLKYWLLTRLRLPDLVGRSRDRRYIVVLPETDLCGALRVSTRIQIETGCKNIEVMSFPADAAKMDEEFR
jgi:hypothetical protein